MLTVVQLVARLVGKAETIALLLLNSLVAARRRRCLQELDLRGRPDQRYRNLGLLGNRDDDRRML
jgi:hypothetical protein